LEDLEDWYQEELDRGSAASLPITVSDPPDHENGQSTTEAKKAFSWSLIYGKPAKIT
jgi:hypothetical protein